MPTAIGDHATVLALRRAGLRRAGSIPADVGRSAAPAGIGAAARTATEQRRTPVGELATVGPQTGTGLRGAGARSAHVDAASAARLPADATATRERPAAAIADMPTAGALLGAGPRGTRTAGAARQTCGGTGAARTGGAGRRTARSRRGPGLTDPCAVAASTAGLGSTLPTARACGGARGKGAQCQDCRQGQTHGSPLEA